MDFTGDGDVFMLRVRGDSMIDAGILDGDFVVARAQTTAEKGDVVVAGIPGEEATVKTYTRKGNKVVLVPPTRGSSRWSSIPPTSRSSGGSSRCCAACRPAPGARCARHVQMVDNG